MSLEKLRRWRRRETIAAMEEREFIGLLERLAAENSISVGLLLCSVCERAIEHSDVGGLYRTASGFMAIVCDKPTCLAIRAGQK